MAFWGHSFVFNGIPCEDFDLMMYDFGSATQSQGSFAGGVTIVESHVPRRWKPYFYGTKIERKLSFSLVFGVNEKRLDEGKYLDRYEMEAIASWLTGHKEYLWLEIEQGDMRYYRYHCMITDLSMVEYGNIPWAFQATVECDGPYAYLHPQTFSFDIQDTDTQITIFNEASYNGYFYPVINVGIGQTAPTYLSIVNHSDNDYEFKLGNDSDDIPSTATALMIDNSHGILTCPEGLNLYKMFNFHFFRLLRGQNNLTVSTDAPITLSFVCEFPINIGG